MNTILNKEKLINDIIDCDEKAEGNLTQKDYRKYGKHNIKTIYRKIGGWNKAKKKAGLDEEKFQEFPRKNKRVTKKKIIEDLKKTSSKIDCFLSQSVYKEYGKYDIKTVRRRIGWNEAKCRAGLETVGFPGSDSINPVKNEKIKNKISSSLKDIFANGNHPNQYDSEVKNKIAEAGSNRDYNKLAQKMKKKYEKGEISRDIPSGEDHHNWKGGAKDYYGSNWRKKRREVIDRDRNSCVICHKDHDQLDKDADVHHIIPIRYYDSIGYEKANYEANLVCLCRSCHMSVEKNPYILTMNFL